MNLDLNMNVSLSSFRELAGSHKVGTRNVVLGNDDGMHVANFAKAGRCSVTSSAKSLNRETMEAFRDALLSQHGIKATDIFDKKLGSRARHGSALRLKDVRSVLKQVAKQEMHDVSVAAKLKRSEMPAGTGRKELEHAAVSKGLTKLFGETRTQAALGQIHTAPRNRAFSPKTFGKLMGHIKEWDTRQVSTAVDAKIQSLKSDGRLSDADIPSVRRDVRANIMRTLNGGGGPTGDSVSVQDIINEAVDRTTDNIMEKRAEMKSKDFRTKLRYCTFDIIEPRFNQDDLKKNYHAEHLFDLKTRIVDSVSEDFDNGRPVYADNLETYILDKAEAFIAEFKTTAVKVDVY